MENLQSDSHIRRIEEATTKNNMWQKISQEKSSMNMQSEREKGQTQQARCIAV